MAPTCVPTPTRGPAGGSPWDTGDSFGVVTSTFLPIVASVVGRRPGYGPEMDFDRITVVIEIPKGSRNKYEMDHLTGAIWLDRHLFTATTYPADYGFIDGTLGGDGDPLDALVMLHEPTFPGCHLWARPIGMFSMHDEAGDDAKVLCVPADDPRWDNVRDLDDVEPHLMNEIRHFFEVYKDLEPNKSADIGEWSGADRAREEIRASVERAGHH
jgi:inorganic pyrophosphatase